MRHFLKNMDLETWIYGYGSLVWKNNDFEFEKKVPGFISGFKRRFYQNSIDHRGIPTKPGRVVTLIKGDENDKVYGMGYKISAENSKKVLDHLDHREKNGYERFKTLFYPIDSYKEEGAKRTIVYVANEKNPSWNSDHNLDSIAQQISQSKGPSGPNSEYFHNLCAAMRQYFPNHYHEDQHLFELEKLLNQLEKTKADE